MISFETIGVIISMVAVVATLIGVAVRVRENTRSLHAQNYGRALDRIAAIQSRLSGDPAMARLFSVGVRHIEDLTPEERIQFTWIFYEMFGGFEFIFDQHRAGTLPPDVWDRWSKTLSWWLSLPGVQAWWRAKPAPFSPRFTDCVDGRLVSPDVDPEAVQRWQAFLWGEGGEKARRHFGHGARPPAQAPAPDRPETQAARA